MSSESFFFGKRLVKVDQNSQKGFLYLDPENNFTSLWNLFLSQVADPIKN